MRILMITFLLTLSACAKNNAPEPLFRAWTGGELGTIDLRDMHIGNNQTVFKGCQCTFAVNGYIDDGSLEIRLCSPDGLTASAHCSSLEAVYDFSGGTDLSLEMCVQGTSTCSVYQYLQFY